MKAKWTEGLVDPHEHAIALLDSMDGVDEDGAKRQVLADANAQAVSNADRLRQAARFIGSVECDDASAHATVPEQLREARTAVAAAAEWYASYGEALRVLATERAVGDA